MEIMSLILFLCVLTTQFVWTVTSPFSPYENMRLLIKNRAGLGSFLSLVLIIQTLRIFDISLVDPVPSWLVILGGGIAVGGTIIACWAKFTMKKVWGVPAQHDRKRQNKLITGGPFSFSRNPIYVGLFMIFTGTELALGSIFIFFTLPLIVIIHQAILNEEILLKKYFKSKYEDYKNKTPRYLVA